MDAETRTISDRVMALSKGRSALCRRYPADLRQAVVKLTRVEWSKGLPVTGTAAQVYSYDELSRLKKFEQGPWNGSAFSGTLSAKHDWTLDEQGNWNKHSDQDSTPGVDWAPPVDSVNAYTSWPTRVDYNRNGTAEYAEGSRRGFTDEVYEDGAHALGTQAQNDHREEMDRVPLAENSTERHYSGPAKWLWGSGVDTTFRYMDGSTRNTIIWPGGLFGGGSDMPSSW